MTVSVSHRRRRSWLQPTRLCAALLLATALAHSFAVLAATQAVTPTPSPRPSLSAVKRSLSAASPSLPKDAAPLQPSLLRTQKAETLPSRAQPSPFGSPPSSPSPNKYGLPSAVAKKPQVVPQSPPVGESRARPPPPLQPSAETSSHQPPRTPPPPAQTTVSEPYTSYRNGPPPAALEPYYSDEVGDEVLVLSVQRDPRLAATDTGDAEERLFFTVSFNSPFLPDEPPPAPIHRRVTFSGDVDAHTISSMETGDRFFINGDQRVPLSPVPTGGAARPGAVVSAFGLSAAAVDEDVDSDYVAATYAGLVVSSFSRYAWYQSYKFPIPRRVTSVTFILNICDKTNPIKRQELQPYWDGSATDGPTLRHFFTECSNRQESFSPETNLIVGPIDVPCSATTSNGRPYNSKRCTDREVFGWAQYAIDYVHENSPDVARALTRAERRIFLLPDLAPCAEWESLASVGCSNNCPIFLKMTPGATARSVASQLIHDLGHSYSLSHSAAREQVLPAGLGGAGGTRADASCPMGNASRPQALVCPNAPNSWKNGWVALLNGSNRFNITGFYNKVVRLPATNVRYDSVVRVNVVSANKLAADPTNKANSVYYISYRRSAAAGNGSVYDTGLAPELNGQVYVHQYDGLAARTGTPYKPLLVGASTSLDASKRIKLTRWAGSYLAVRLIDADASAATVRICVATGRRGGLPASEDALGCGGCMDGLDNDCNGLVDEEDPACKACTAGGRRAAV